MIKYPTPSQTTVDLLQKGDTKISAMANGAFNSLQALAWQKVLSPVWLIAFAVETYPDKTPLDAIKELRDEFDNLLYRAKMFNTQYAEIEAAERARVTPILGRASRQLFDATAELAAIENKFKSAKLDTQNRYAKLKAAGLSDADVEKVTPVFDGPTMGARSNWLRARIELLEKFLKTKDEAILPADFYGEADHE